MANNNICAFYNAEKRSYRHAQNLQKTQQQQQMQQQQQNTNSFHVLIDNTTRQW